MNAGWILVWTLSVSAQTGAADLLTLQRAECVVDKDGAVACGFGCATSARGQAQCATEPGGTCVADANGTVQCSEPSGLTIRVPLVPAECKQGADGSTACGYACVVDANGRPHCAQTPDGACLVGPQGRAVCSDLPAEGRLVVLTDRIAPQCKRSGDGRVACGYGCAKNARGHVRCASTPDGACATDANGTIVCTDFDVRRRIFVGAPPEATCLKGASGKVRCGYGCVREVSGLARCSSSPLGACATGADGHARCFPDDG